MTGQPQGGTPQHKAAVAQGIAAVHLTFNGAAACGCGSRWRSRVMTTTRTLKKVTCGLCLRTHAARVHRKLESIA